MNENRIIIKDILHGDKDIINNNVVNIFGIIEDINEKKTLTNSTYIQFNIKDSTGSISCKAWDSELKDLKDIRNGDIIKIRAKIEYYKDKPQLTLEDYKGDLAIRHIIESDNIDINDFYKVAPVTFDEMYNYLLNQVNSFKNEELKKVCTLFFNKYKNELMYYPGAKSNHHAYKLGLLYHIYNMSKQAVEISKIYRLNRDLLVSGVILHDIGKIKTMNSTEYGVVTDFTLEGVFLEHLVQGVLMVEELAKEANISYDIKLLLLHMIASHHGIPEWGSYRVPSFPEAEVLHHLDNMDSKIVAMLENIDNVSEETGLTSNIYGSLGGRLLYKHNL